MKNLLLGLGILVSVCATGQQVAKGLTASNGSHIGFYEYKPTDYNVNTDTKYPLIIFLHGMGERGNGTTELSRVLANAIPKYINAGHKMRFFWNGKWETFLVLSPQLSNGYGWWQTWYIDEMIKYAKQNLRVDTNRIVLTGLSLGGGGVWQYAAASVNNSRQLSAIGMCCPTCEGVDYCNISKANLPAWAFHATDDGTTQAACTGAAIQAISNCGAAAQPYITLWPTGGHFVWDRAYDTAYKYQNPNIFEWFLGQNKSLPVNKRPKAHAGKNLTISTSTATVNLSATQSTDEDGRIVRYIWRKISGPSAGNIQTPVSTNGRTAVTNLTTPGTYQFEVKAIDDRADYSFNTVTITVVSGTVSNIEPVAEAGPNQHTEYGITSLDGSDSYDPDGTVVHYKWKKVDGPALFSLSDDQAVNPTLSNLLIGTYKFELETTDNLGAISRDTVEITSNSFPLPVKLRYFKGTKEKNGVRLQWATEMEYHNDHFTIERSTDGTDYATIARIQGRNLSASLVEYEYLDEQLLSEMVYYRLKQVGADGKSTHLQTITIRPQAMKGNIVQVYPNPVRNTLTVTLQQSDAGTVKLNLYSLDGRLVRQKQMLKQHSIISTSIDLRDLDNGVYLLEVVLEDRLREVRKVIKQ